MLYRNISSDVHGGAGQPGDEDLASVYGSNRMTWSSHKTFSRMKDFYDLYVLARDFTFDGNTLSGRSRQPSRDEELTSPSSWSMSGPWKN